MMIFESSARPTLQCHASTIAETKNGLVAAWFGGDHEKHPNVGVWLSRKDGKNWSKPVEVANGKRAHELPVPCWNPVLCQHSSGPLLLFYKVGREIRAWQTMLITSIDQGITWSTPMALPDGTCGPVKNKPIELADGVLVCPASAEPSWQSWQVYFSFTSDLGQTWQTVGPCNDNETYQAIQPALLTCAGGDLWALCRTRQGHIAQMHSSDSGQTWSKMSPTNMPNPNSGIDAVTLADGRHLLVYNHTVKGRSPLNVAIYEDGRWKMREVLEDDPGEYSYPAVIQGTNGDVHITYTYNRETIAHRVIQP